MTSQTFLNERIQEDVTESRSIVSEEKPDKNKIIYQCEHQTLCHTSFGSL